MRPFSAPTEDEFFSGDHEGYLLSAEQLLRPGSVAGADLDLLSPAWPSRPGVPDPMTPASAEQGSTPPLAVGELGTAPTATSPPPASGAPLPTVAEATHAEVAGTETTAGWDTVPVSPSLSPEDIPAIGGRLLSAWRSYHSPRSMRVGRVGPGLGRGPQWSQDARWGEGGGHPRTSAPELGWGGHLCPLPQGNAKTRCRPSRSLSSRTPTGAARAHG